MASYVICDTTSKVVGENFLAIPPAVQLMLNLTQNKVNHAVIDGQPVQLVVVGFAETTCKSDVVVLHNDKLVTLKR